jgi:putative tryptophan/tyrosine transport system substrate-binding protein
LREFVITRGDAPPVLRAASAAQHLDLIAKLAMQYRRPSIDASRVEVEARGLASYGTDLTDLARRAASCVDRILKGEKSCDLPVQLLTRYHLVVNLKTAKAIGLDIPPNVLALAEKLRL